MFLCKNSPKEINVRQHSTQKIEELLKNNWVLRNDIFDGLVKEVNDLLKDSLSRFRETMEFKNLKKQIQRKSLGSCSSDSSFPELRDFTRNTRHDSIISNSSTISDVSSASD